MKTRKNILGKYFCQGLCYLVMALFLLCSCKTITLAKNSDSATSYVQSPIKKYFRGNDEENEVKIASYEKEVLQSDKHLLVLSNVTDDMKVTFKSSDTSILTVKKISDNKCRYVGTGYGTAKINIEVETDGFVFFLKDVKTYSVKISVSPHATSVKWVNTKKTIFKGDTVALKLTIRPSVSTEVPTFRSSNLKVASISRDGKVTAKKAGKTYVTATIDNGITTKCCITVKQKPEPTDEPKPTASPKPSESPEPDKTELPIVTPFPTRTKSSDK